MCIFAFFFSVVSLYVTFDDTVQEKFLQWRRFALNWFVVRDALHSSLVGVPSSRARAHRICAELRLPHTDPLTTVQAYFCSTAQAVTTLRWSSDRSSVHSTRVFQA